MVQGVGPWKGHLRPPMKASHCLHVPSCWSGRHHAQPPSPSSYNGVSSSCEVHLKLLYIDQMKTGGSDQLEWK